LRVNEAIRAPQIRVIDENGQMLGVMTPSEGVSIAKTRGLDLLEVSPTAEPPVCKIADYGKFKYEKKKKTQDAKRKQAVINVKEVQMRPVIDEHDLNYKTNNIKRFLSDGDKAKVTVNFRGREIAYVENGHKLIARIMEEVKDIATVESAPKLEGKRLTVIFAPLATAVAAKGQQNQKSANKDSKSDKKQDSE
jgi:translation initiation factor IF-3